MTRDTRRVLVTGAAGRLGRPTLDLLAGHGVPVTALDLHDPGDLPADRVVTGEAGDFETVRAAMDGVDTVIHLAAIPAPTLGTPEEVFLGNTRATFAVFQEAARAGVRRVVFASSLSVLGLPFSPRALHPAYVPIDEALPLQVEDPYALSKQTDEAIAVMMARRHGVDSVAMRFPLLGGPGDKLPDRAAMYARDPAEGARELWSYLDLRDAARANRLAATRPLTGANVVFLAAPTTLCALPTEELLDRYHPGAERRAPLPGRAVPIDLSAASRLLGFQAEHLYPVEAHTGEVTP
ncbi:NAD(P)-dependent oxidoreductase [Sphaerisporangium sp. NPDC051011]|uniref:NAD-dependent epimerase/dehydratase family protein n=1 Tax=Sphaerisporangium sp. NPDC051011 TaxID=3155792 RepID=UPI0033D8BE03